MMTIAEFCDKHHACTEGSEWALRECKTMGDVWRTAKPDWLLWVAMRPGVLDDVTLRIFSVECARSVQHLVADARSTAAIDVAERHSLGDATDDELAAARAAASYAARAAARAAAWSAARGSARAAASYAASDAARAAEWSAASDAARAAASYAARAAARAAAWGSAMAAASDAARAAAWGSAMAAQAEWLRASAEPNFDGGAK